MQTDATASPAPRTGGCTDRHGPCVRLPQALKARRTHARGHGAASPAGHEHAEQRLTGCDCLGSSPLRSCFLKDSYATGSMPHRPSVHFP